VTRSRHTQSEGSSETGQRPTRRRFLVGAGTAAAGIATMSGTAVAGGDGDDDLEVPGDYPLISTRNHFDITWYGSVYLTDSETGYQRDGNWSGYDNGEDVVTVFVHGWGQSEEEGRNGAYICEQALADNSVDSFNVSYNWDSDKGGGIDQGWYEAKEIASRNGPKFADWITDFDRDDGRTLRIIAHSLGARVTASALQTLDGWDKSDIVDSVTFLGGAIDDQEVETDEPFGTAIENVTGQFDNYYKTDDGVLDWAYSTAEFDSAVGQYGIEDGSDAPSNYEDHNVTDTVPGHGSYYEPGEGCIPQVVEEF